MSVIGNPSLFIYSAHDTNVDNMLVWLTQDHNSFDYVPFASQVTFELKYSPECVENSPTEDCFGVAILYNGLPMEFPNKCAGGDGFSDDQSGCTYTDFKQLMQSIWYKGKPVESANLDLACYE